MGTSASSSGPRSGVLLIPPWVPEPEIDPEVVPEADQDPVIDEPVDPAAGPTPDRAGGSVQRS